jgi:hypothetical protein
MSLIISDEFRFQIASYFRDPKDLIALGGTDKAWRAVVSDVLRKRIETIFGNSFIGVRDPVTAAAELWAPLRPRTTQLSQVLLKQNKNPISDEMKKVLLAASSGSIDELKQAIQALKDPSELTELKFGPILSSSVDKFSSPQNPLSLAAESGVIGKVQALIDCSIPIGVGVSGIFKTDGTPVMIAARKGCDDILRLLLERGASFSVKVDEHDPSQLLYLMFESMRVSPLSDGQIRCATLAMRSWRHEKGFESIQEDRRLHTIAKEYILREGDIRIIQLLKAYGVDGSNPQFTYEMGFSVHGSSDIDSSWLDNTNVWFNGDKL